MRPLRHGGSHFVNAFWHGNQDDSDVAIILVAMPKFIIIHETMVVHMTWVWTVFNNYIY